MSFFRHLEQHIDEKLRSMFRSSDTRAPERRELVEVHRAILEDIAAHSQVLPRARRILPFSSLTIQIVVPEQDRRAAYSAVLIQGDAFQHEIIAHLRREQIEHSRDLSVTVVLVDEDLPGFAHKGFQVIYGNPDRPPQPSSSTVVPLPTVRLTIISGQAEQPAYDFRQPRVYVGRIREVLDERKRPVRRNDLVFLEHSDVPNSTVSRAHAHIQWDSGQSEFRIYDDGSSFGTSVLHEGHLLDVSRSGGRGLRLSSGDEIYFGQVRVRCEIVPSV